MAKIIHESAGKMTQLCRRIVHVKIKWSVLERVSVFRQFFRFIWDRILACSVGRPGRYRRLSRRNSCPSMEAMELGLEPHDLAFSGYSSDSDSDLVALKISILGDCQIGKTSFVVSPTLCYNHNFSCSCSFFFFFFNHLICGFSIFSLLTLFFCFKVKYVGDEQEKRGLETQGLNLMDKTLCVQGARIAFRIWDVGG